MQQPISLDQQTKQSQKQTQRLMMTPQMQQAIHLLQLPIMELAQVLEQELEQNPVLETIEEEEDEDSLESESEEDPEKELEFDENQLAILKQLDEDFRDLFAESGQFVPFRSADEEKKQAFLESLIQEKPSLFEHLMTQARERFNDPQELKIAEIIFGHLDPDGLLSTPLGEIAAFFSLDLAQIEKVYQIIQSFEPEGIGGRNIQEVLLTQLRLKGLQDSLAYKIIEQHYDDLLHNRLPVLQKAFKVSMAEVRKSIQEDIARLNLHPGMAYTQEEAQALVPDVRLRQEGEALFIEVNEERLLPLRLNRKYLKMLDDPSLSSETKEFIRSKVLSARWLMKNVHQRNDTLHRIAESIIQHQKAFLLASEGKLKPWVMKDLAEELGVHESTIARAVANKYIDTPKGILPFRYFFSNAYVDIKGNSCSSKTVRDLVKEIISREDAHHPVSDETISRRLRNLGIPCARRTVAKYRAFLGIGNTQQRRVY
jgi:RNA polymerase sigma-54 factor